MGELENWRLLVVWWRVRAFWVRRMGWKAKRVGVEVWRVRVWVVVVSVRRGAIDGVGRWTMVRKARRASGEIN